MSSIGFQRAKRLLIFGEHLKSRTRELIESKDSKVNILLHDFELFRMQPRETIGDMYTRFTDVVNNLRVLGKSLSNFDLISKILRSLPKR